MCLNKSSGFILCSVFMLVLIVSLIAMHALSEGVLQIKMVGAVQQSEKSRWVARHCVLAGEKALLQHLGFAAFGASSCAGRYRWKNLGQRACWRVSLGKRGSRPAVFWQVSGVSLDKSGQIEAKSAEILRVPASSDSLCRGKVIWVSRKIKYNQ